MADIHYSIVIPAYNEQERIGASLETLLAHISRRRWRAEVLVVNDGSTDGTAEIVARIARHNPGVKLLQNPGNRGKGYSVRHGLQMASGDLVLFTDADLSTPIHEADKLFAALENGADVAIGSRWMESRLQTQRQPFHRQVVGRMFNLVLWATLRLNYQDTQCGFKAFRRRTARALSSMQQVERWGFDAELLFLARKLGLRIREVPVEWAHDHRSKIRVFRDGLRMVADLLIVRWYQISSRYKLRQATERLYSLEEIDATLAQSVPAFKAANH
ncbi:MAG: dolichyl-phosphate beta-glucosyltransferase [Candidatus Korobacteraceae bacterium]